MIPGARAGKGGASSLIELKNVLKSTIERHVRASKKGSWQDMVAKTSKIKFNLFTTEKATKNITDIITSRIWTR
jgi:hypothetical protein